MQITSNDIEFDGSSIEELDDANEIYYVVSKEKTKAIFEAHREQPKDEEGTENNEYSNGDLQFIFDNETNELSEILLFPVYEDDDGNAVNGDFIALNEDEVTDCVDIAKERLLAELAS